MKTFQEYLEENMIEEGYVIKHKKTGKVLSSHPDEESAKDEHSGLDNKEDCKSNVKPKRFGMKEETINNVEV